MVAQKKSLSDAAATVQAPKSTAASDQFPDIFVEEAPSQKVSAPAIPLEEVTVKAAKKAAKKETKSVQRKKTVKKATKKTTKKIARKATKKKSATVVKKPVVVAKKAPARRSDTRIRAAKKKILENVKSVASTEKKFQKSSLKHDIPAIPQTGKYRGWLTSDSFIKRSLAVFGYNFVGSLLVMIPFYILLFAVSFVIFGFFDFSFDSEY